MARVKPQALDVGAATNLSRRRVLDGGGQEPAPIHQHGSLPRRGERPVGPQRGPAPVQRRRLGRLLRPPQPGTRPAGPGGHGLQEEG